MLPLKTNKHEYEQIFLLRLDNTQEACELLVLSISLCE
jgi:hypothetical protein